MKHIAQIKIDIDTLCEIETLCTPLDLEDLTDDDNFCKFLEIEEDEDYPTAEELIEHLQHHKGHYLVIDQEITRRSAGSWSWNNKYSFEKKQSRI